MRLDEAIGIFIGHRRSKSLAKNSIERYRQALQRWQRWRAAAGRRGELATIGIEELRAFFAYLLEEHIPHSDNPRRRPAAAPGLAPASVLSTRNVMRAFWMFAAGEGWLAAEQLDFFRGDRIPRPFVAIEDRPFWNDALVEQLLAACEAQPAEQAARLRAIVLLFYESGMRLEELSTIAIGPELLLGERAARITGKGRKKRWIFWHHQAAQALGHYLALRRGPAAGPIFVGDRGRPMSKDAIRAAIKRLAERAGIELPSGAPIHAGRHGFAHAMIDGGAEISEVAQLMGHSDINTTYRYIRERRERLQLVHRRAHSKRLQSPKPRTHNR